MTFRAQFLMFLTTARKILTGIWEGKAIASTKLRNERYAACWNCPCLNPVSERCMVCGCFMKAKTAFEEATCPKDKWKK